MVAGGCIAVGSDGSRHDDGGAFAMRKSYYACKHTYDPYHNLETNLAKTVRVVPDKQFTAHIRPGSRIIAPPLAVGTADDVPSLL